MVRDVDPYAGLMSGGRWIDCEGVCRWGSLWHRVGTGGLWGVPECSGVPWVGFLVSDGPRGRGARFVGACRDHANWCQNFLENGGVRYIAGAFLFDSEAELWRATQLA